ncbi:Transcription factor [Lachnellula hyalina]|uniref:Transcription factor n=1 Tax=Lachnellula hyalina TaxID=1316788 RepID=A0A8H8R6X3_9HELO|nr:Transcription factor [Lachnellula hyalina]TVY29684.1 Transcription factor [Lachnellula hyalina]
MSGSGFSSPDAEPPRKRVRKGTRSCWECKRRKIKCQLSSEDVPVCSGCLTRGTTCLSQEYPEEREPSSNTQMGERLGRVERLLETLVAKVTQYEEEDKVQQDILTPESMGTEDLTPYTSASSGVSQETPFMTLFDNNVLGRRENGPSSMPTPAQSSSGTKTPSCRPPKIDRIRQTLIDILPSQRDAQLISQNSSCWLLIHAMSTHTTSMFGDREPSVVPPIFDLAEISKKHPTIIARTILYLAVCLQQLNPDFDTKQLHLLPSVEARMERYLATVSGLITSDDELISTMEGLECLSLQGVYHINAGNPRRAWLTFRRALNIGQLMGIHRRSTEIPNGQDMWFQIFQADRYLALLLGLPVGSPDNDFAPDETFQNPAIDKPLLFSRKLSQLTALVIDRNQCESSNAYATTQQIDEKLDNLAKNMPESWWAIPTFFAEEGTPKAAEQFDSLMTQVWYFQLEALVHLPYMLRAATERRYEYSKFSCLKSSREMIYRYLAMRSTANSRFCCKVIDFGALTATVTLFLGLIEPSQGDETTETRQRKDNDRKLIHTVLKSLEMLSDGGKNVIASQSSDVIRSLLAVDSPSGRAAGNLRLTIPYFGTISIVRPPATKLPPTPPNPTTPYAEKRQTIITLDSNLKLKGTENSNTWPDMSLPSSDPVNMPMVSFTSSRYPSLVSDQLMQDWGLQEADNLFFDSLLNTDIDGNWVL